MSINISDRQLTQQYENCAIDMDRLRQKFQHRDKDNVVPTRYDTVDISEDSRKALENKMLESVKARQGIEVCGTLTAVSSLSVFEDYEKAVSAEKRDKVTSNNFERHIDKMLSAYQRMKCDIEEKYANMSPEQQKQQYYVADDKSIQKLTKEKELEMLDEAYAQHSEAMAFLTESLNELQDFKPRITYHQSESSVKEQPISTGNAKKKKGEIRDQAYQVFMSAINKESSQSNIDVFASSRNELNRIWDFYANLK